MLKLLTPDLPIENYFDIRDIDVSNVTSESDTSREVTPYEVTHYQNFRYRETEGFNQEKEPHVIDLLYKLSDHVHRVDKDGLACLKL